MCTAGLRRLVHKSCFDEVVEGLSGIAAGMKFGAGIDPTTPIGSLLSATQQKRVLGYRGGDRSANSASWTIAMVRMRSDPRTRAYRTRKFIAA